MRLAWAYAVVIACFCASTFPAHAIWLSENGSSAWLSGSIEHGDEETFKAFLEKPRSQPLQVVHLSSEGGFLTPAMAIGRLIRKAGLATAVDAGRTSCDSACTFIFAGGVRRHYVNAESLFEGLSGHAGLGFHPSHSKGNRIRSGEHSERGTARMRAFYAEMGMPRAADLMQKASITTMFRPNARTAQELRIATSLAAP
jgi:hypothetical protein